MVAPYGSRHDMATSRRRIVSVPVPLVAYEPDGLDLAIFLRSDVNRLAEVELRETSSEVRVSAFSREIEQVASDGHRSVTSDGWSTFGAFAITLQSRLDGRRVIDGSDGQPLVSLDHLDAEDERKAEESRLRNGGYPTWVPRPK